MSLSKAQQTAWSVIKAAPQTAEDILCSQSPVAASILRPQPALTIEQDAAVNEAWARWRSIDGLEDCAGAFSDCCLSPEARAFQKTMPIKKALAARLLRDGLDPAFVSIQTGIPPEVVSQIQERNTQ
jgi:hypothetical protein